MDTKERFAVPDHGETYIQQIVDRARSLIRLRIWEGLQEARLDTWLNNFSGPEEMYFAACVLDTLIYRSTRQTVALMERVLRRGLEDLSPDDATEAMHTTDFANGFWRKREAEHLWHPCTPPQPASSWRE